MTIVASVLNNGKSIEVEVLDVWTSSRGKVARVRAIHGEPFCSWTHGGWCYSAIATVRVDQLQGVAVSVDLPVSIPEAVQS